MKIFISHPIKDENLALRLKSVLEASDEIEIAHIAQKEKDFEIEVSQKIIKQINESDYLVAIITSNSKTSASVNQELGYSQGIKRPKIPLIEESAKKGCLIYGKDSVDFTRANFSEKCNEVLEHILNSKNNSSKIRFEEEMVDSRSNLSFQDYLMKAIPPVYRAYRRVVIVPSNRFVRKPFSNDVIKFVKNGPEMFQKEYSKLQQDEILLIGRKDERNHIRYGIINEKGQIALQEILHYDKIVEVGRELVYLLSALFFAKDFYKKIDYQGALSIKYEHQGVQNFHFEDGPDSSWEIIDPHTVQKTPVIISRSVNSNFNVLDTVDSIMNEFGRACDWVPDENYFVHFLHKMIKDYFPNKPTS